MHFTFETPFYSLPVSYNFFYPSLVVRCHKHVYKRSASFPDYTCNITDKHILWMYFSFPNFKLRGALLCYLIKIRTKIMM